jgi:hypothetical protein
MITFKRKEDDMSCAQIKVFFSGVNVLASSEQVRPASVVSGPAPRPVLQSTTSARALLRGAIGAADERARGAGEWIHEDFEARPLANQGVGPSAKNHFAYGHLRGAHGFSPGDSTVDFVIWLRSHILYHSIELRGVTRR